MKHFFTVILLLITVAELSISQVYPPTKEFRSVWLTTVTNLDYPKTQGAQNQQNELINIIQNLKNNNFNTVVLQVRSRGDLLYPSAIEPWAKCLTGQLGKDPGWDPLQVAVEECHKRGMELHAWWNFALVANGTSAPSSVGLPHVASAHPTWVKQAGSQLFMDVGLPEVREYLVNLAMEMVRKYDIDAIHFDYIRYSESTSPAFDDNATYNTYGGGMSKADWRRENINMFVRAVYDSIKKVKPWVKVGSTPIGNYAPGVPGVGPALYGYSNCYQDSRRWMIENKHDYLAPQIYWDLTGNFPYNVILKNWLDNSGPRHIYGGIAAYKNDTTSVNSGAVFSQIGDIIDYTRSLGAKGEIYFRYEHISSGNFYGLKGRYANPANIPPMPWIDSIPPGKPSNLSITKIDSKTYKLTWEKPSSGLDGDTVKYYNIYRSNTSTINTNDATNLYYITTNSDNSININFATEPTQNYYFAVSALDRNNVESELSNVVSIIVTDVTELNMPKSYVLEQNYPNPFNPSTVIAYNIESKGFVSLKVYNVLGEEIKTLVNDVKEPGRYNVTFNATNLPSGVYFYKIDVISNNSRFTDIKKMILAK